MIDAHTSIAGKRHFSKLLMLTFRTDGRFFLAKIYLSPVNSKSDIFPWQRALFKSCRSCRLFNQQIFSSLYVARSSLPRQVIANDMSTNLWASMYKTQG